MLAGDEHRPKAAPFQFLTNSDEWVDIASASDSAKKNCFHGHIYNSGVYYGVCSHCNRLPHSMNRLHWNLYE